MPQRKPQQFWAVYDPQGVLIPASIERHRKDAIDMVFFRPFDPPTTWAQEKRHGYRVARVEVREVVTEPKR